MLKRTLPLITPLLTLVLAACVTPTTDPARLPGGAWALDPDHASVTWSVRHMGLSWYTGRFDRIEASLDFDPAAPAGAQLTALIDAASISTGNADFDQQLADGWLQAGRHPQVMFVSDRIDITGDNRGQVHGMLTLRGESRPATLDVTFHGGAFSPFIQRNIIGFSGDMTIDRDAFGVGNLPTSIVGREVRVHIEVEFLRQGDTHE